jgi:protein-L-isoaspartate O-methyltransferase
MHETREQAGKLAAEYWNKAGKSPGMDTPFVDDAFYGLGKEGQADEQFHTIMSELAPRKGNDVLYVGAGSGMGSYVLAKMVAPGKVFSYEINKGRLEDTTLHYLNRIGMPKNLELIHGDAFKLEGRHGFDRAVVMAGGRKYPYLPEIGGECRVSLRKVDGDAIGWLHSHLKTGGKAVIPLGELVTWWEVDSHAEIFRVEAGEESVNIKNLGMVTSWAVLEGRLGFSYEEIREQLKKDPSFSEDML